MAIIPHKEIFDDSKKVFKNFDKDLDKANEKVITLTKSSKELAEALSLVKKSNDGTEAKKLAEGTNKLTKSTKKLKDALTAEERVKKQIIAANKRLADSQTEQAKQLALVRQKTLQQNKALREQAKATLKVRKGISSLTKQMFAGLGIIAGFRALGRVITNALKIYKEFEKESSRLAAIVGKSKDEIKSLTDQAKLLGSTTAFTAKQVIELQIELGKLGFSLKEIEASTPGILDLAAATGTDLASAAELAGATLRIFNLDASQMSRVTDVLALSTTKSSLSMEKLATILPTVGKTAQVAGLSLEQTAALAGTLTDRGIDASSAGTALRNIFLKLAKDGLTWNEAMSQVNASTDKLRTATEIFGVRASTAGIVVAETASSTDILTEALNNADGAAKRMADTMLNNLAGDITKAESAWEGFINSLITGEGKLSKTFRAITQAGTNFLGVLTDLNNGMTLFQIRAKKTSALTEGLAKDTKAWTEQIAKLNTVEEKTNFINNKSLGIRRKISGQELTLRNIQNEIANNTLNIFSKEFRERGKLEEQTKFNIIAYKEQVKVLNSLIPVEKANNVEIETSAAANRETASELKKRIKAEEDLIKTLRKKDVVAPTESKQSEIILSDTQKLEDDKALIEENARVKKKEADEEAWEDTLERATTNSEAQAAILQQFAESSTSLARDIFNSFQNEKLAKLASDSEAQKTILQERLDAGIISEEQFAAKSAAIDKKFRSETAKADKKKALFDIAIRTAIAVISALTSIPPNVPLSIAVGITGGIQAAAVLARPIDFNEGTESVPGQGNKDTVPAMLTPGERVVPAEINRMLDGIPNSELPARLNGQENNMFLAGLLMQNNDTSKKMLAALLNGGYTVTKNGQVTEYKMDGSSPKTSPLK